MSTGSEYELTILYGSQTGNAEFLAYNVSEAAKQAGLGTELLTLNDALEQGTFDWQRLLVVTATHDNGHMPDNANGFWKWLQSCPDEQFAGLPYAVLAIGDSMYDDFCKAGQDFDQRFMELGATQIQERIDCDVDYDMTSEKWVQTFIERIPSVPAWQPIAVTQTGSEMSSQFIDEAEVWHEAKIFASRTLTEPDSQKKVVHFDIAVDESFTYLPGDSIDIAIRNSDKLISEWRNRFPDVTEVSFRDENILFTEALAERLELRTPHLSMVNDLIALAPESAAKQLTKQLIASGDRPAIDAWLWGKDVLSVVEELQLDRSALPAIINSMRPLQHRSYSIASSPLISPHVLSLTVSVISYELGGRTHLGAGTHFLEEVAKTGSPFAVRRIVAHEFHLPEQEAPIIMIGPGVGIAPFIGFLQDLEARSSAAQTWLFFGDRHCKTDSLYHNELDQWLRDGRLTKLSLAFSRDQEKKHYVQDELLSNSSEILEWVDRGAYIYICGDKDRMAHDVESALAHILSTGTSEEQGKKRLDELKDVGRYAKDVY